MADFLTDLLNNFLPLTFSSILIVGIFLLVWVLRLKIVTFIVYIDKYPSGEFVKFKETGKELTGTVHETSTVFIKKYSPLILKWKRKIIRLFLTVKGVNHTCNWDILGKEVKTDFDEFRVGVYATEKFFSGLFKKLTGKGDFILGAISGGMIASGIWGIFLVMAKLI